MEEIPLYNYPRIAESYFCLILVIIVEYLDHMEADIEDFNFFGYRRTQLVVAIL